MREAEEALMDAQSIFHPLPLVKVSLGTAFIADDDDDVLLVVSFLPPSVAFVGPFSNLSLRSITPSLTDGHFSSSTSR